MVAVFLIDIIRGIIRSAVMFRYRDMLCSRNLIWPLSAIFDWGIRLILIQIQKLGDLIYAHAKQRTVLNSYNLLDLVKPSNRRHLGFFVQTKNNTRIVYFFHVSYICFQRYHMFPCDVQIPRNVMAPKYNPVYFLKLYLLYPHVRLQTLQKTHLFEHNSS